MVLSIVICNILTMFNGKYGKYRFNFCISSPLSLPIEFTQHWSTWPLLSICISFLLMWLNPVLRKNKRPALSPSFNVFKMLIEFLFLCVHAFNLLCNVVFTLHLCKIWSPFFFSLGVDLGNFVLHAPIQLISPAYPMFSKPLWTSSTSPFLVMPTTFSEIN